MICVANCFLPQIFIKALKRLSNFSDNIVSQPGWVEYESIIDVVMKDRMKGSTVFRTDNGLVVKDKGSNWIGIGLIIL